MLYHIFIPFILACGPSSYSNQELPSQSVEEVSSLPTTTEDVTRIYFIHNAESEYSVQDEHGTKFTSGKSPEVHLNELGKKQADRLAKLFSSRIDQAIVFLPPAVRTKETAKPLLSDTITFGGYYEGLLEVGMGDWEGKPKDEAYKNAYQNWKDLPAISKYGAPKVASGESYQKAAARALKDLETIIQLHPGQTIVVISGENLLNALAICWMQPALSEEPESGLPLLPMAKGDFFLVELPQGKFIEEAKVKVLFHIGKSE